MCSEEEKTDARAPREGRPSSCSGKMLAKKVLASYTVLVMQQAGRCIIKILRKVFAKVSMALICF